MHSLVEAMALIAKHKTRLPQADARAARGRRHRGAPERHRPRAVSPPRAASSCRGRDPIDGRDPRRPGHLASRTPTPGCSCATGWPAPTTRTSRCCSPPAATARRAASGCAEILRRTTLRGIDLATNLRVPLRPDLTGSSPATSWAKPTTKFVVPYLTLVGLLEQEAQSIDLDYAFQQIATARAAARRGAGKARSTPRARCSSSRRRCSSGRSAQLIDEPHFLSAWLQHSSDLDLRDRRQRVVWQRNPVEVLAETYHLLQHDRPAGRRPRPTSSGTTTASCSRPRSASTRGSGTRAPTRPTSRSSTPRCAAPRPRFGFERHRVDAGARRTRSATSSGLEILGRAAADRREGRLLRPEGSGRPDHRHPRAPARRGAAGRDEEGAGAAAVTKSDEIVAAMGGMFYARRRRHLPLFVDEGRPLREGRSALHHRSHEDVQQGATPRSPARSTRSSSRATAPSCTRASPCSRSPRTRSSSWRTRSSAPSASAPTRTSTSRRWSNQQTAVCSRVGPHPRAPASARERGGPGI